MTHQMRHLVIDVPYEHFLVISEHSLHLDPGVLMALVSSTASLSPLTHTAQHPVCDGDVHFYGYPDIKLDLIVECYEEGGGGRGSDSVGESSISSISSHLVHTHH